MRVIKRLALIDFCKRFPRATEPMDDWFRLTERVNWAKFIDVRQTFGQTDVSKVSSGNTVCIFDIGGNKWRIIAKVSYEKGKVYILRVLTHKEYDTAKWKNEL